jgi:hypothetical protein
MGAYYHSTSKLKQCSQYDFGDLEVKRQEFHVLWLDETKQIQQTGLDVRESNIAANKISHAMKN